MGSDISFHHIWTKSGFDCMISLERKEIFENSKQHFSAHEVIVNHDEVYLFMHSKWLRNERCDFRHSTTLTSYTKCMFLLKREFKSLKFKKSFVWALTEHFSDFFGENRGFDPLTPGAFLPKLRFLDILVVFRLDISQINGWSLSEHFSLESGVPQGSCLGPLLFLIYASKLFRVVEDQLPQAY